MQALMCRIALTLLLYCSLPAHAQGSGDELLTRIAAQLDRHAVVRAEFAQSKQVAALKRPLLTSGHLLFSRQQGVLWQIEQPYRVSYILGEERVVEIAADGSRKERLAGELPGMAQVGRVFRAMLGGNTTALRNYFELQAQGDVNRWTLTLKPRQAQVAQFIEQLEIRGGAFVSEVRMFEAGGDVTQIRFRNSIGSNAPSEAEQLLLNGGVPRP